jgi:hypothetical protein
MQMQCVANSRAASAICMQNLVRAMCQPCASQWMENVVCVNRGIALTVGYRSSRGRWGTVAEHPYRVRYMSIHTNDHHEVYHEV